MSHYIKVATSAKGTAFYIGKSRNPYSRGNPTLSEKIKNWGASTWKIIKVVSDCDLHPEFGESFLINCFKEKFGEVKLLNTANPHAGVLGYDEKSKKIIDELEEMV